MANTIPTGAQPLSASATGTTGALSLTLGATTNVGRIVYLSGLSYQSTGATATANITITAAYTPVSGAAVTLGTWTYGTGTTVASFGAPLTIPLLPPMASNAPVTGLTNTNPVGSIVVTATAAGAGATGAILNAWGYLQ